MTILNFDARNVAPDSGAPEPVPAGWYNVVISDSEGKATNDNTGSYLQVTYKVLDGQYANRSIIGRFNLRNSSEQAMKIGMAQLSALCHAVGIMVVEDSRSLHNIPLKIKVSLRPGTEKKDKVTGQPTGEFYEASNEVKAWKNINEPVDMAPAAAAPQRPAAPAGAMAAPPTTWGAPPQQPAAPMAPQQPAQAAPWQAPGAVQPPAQWQPPAQAPQQPQAPVQAPPWQAGAAAPTVMPQQPMPPQQPAQPMAPPWAGQPAAPQQPAAPAAGAPMAPPWAAGGAPATPPWATPAQ